MTKLKITLAQINVLVGDVRGNTEKIIASSLKARDELKADAVIFPELTVTAYPPEDLLFRQEFITTAGEAVIDIARETAGIQVVLGFPEASADGRLYNSAAILGDGSIRAVYRKNVLPNYGVFDEKRYFTEGEDICIAEIGGVRAGITICEDIWTPGVVERSRAAGAEFIVNLNASPFHADKMGQRERVIRERIDAAKIPFIYVNQIGGQDELIFDGASFVMNAAGETVYRAPEFSEQLGLVEFDHAGVAVPRKSHCAPRYNKITSEYQALVLGVKDYVRKNGFHGVILGLSGGIDSALTLAIAVDALGKDQVEVVLMPSRYTQDMSNEDARQQAETLGVRHQVIPIEPAVNAFNEMLAETFSGLTRDVTEENIQARCRGIVLMAISNKQRKLLLTTGNKSEMSVGYATLYGDMAGGFAPLKDVPKLLVYELSRYRNTLGKVIPDRVISRPPSAELAPDQVDQDSLPAYSSLDPILEMYIEQDRSASEIIAAGFCKEDVKLAISLVDSNEYKRRQSPPGIRITPRAFGRDRRYPITSGFRGLARL